MECCNMKGFLSYLIMWNISKKSMTGAELSADFEKRKGTKPSPGTIYPALKELFDKGLIKRDDKKKYTITKKGMKELMDACNSFHKMFYDAHKMVDCCKRKD